MQIVHYKLARVQPWAPTGPATALSSLKNPCAYPSILPIRTGGQGAQPLGCGPRVLHHEGVAQRTGGVNHWCRQRKLS